MTENKYCCGDMEDLVIENKEIEYDQSIRKYYLRLMDDSCGTHKPLLYCPWCGTKLPEDLNETWGDILEKEYGIEDPCFDDADRVPEEFKSDEWWKKRGL